MHTAFDFTRTDFTIEVNGLPSRREDLLQWGSHDRLGVVIDRPYGAVGAGLLILLVATAFFDVPEKNRRRKPIYPEIHLFHAGGAWGNFIGFDFFPTHKEVFGPSSARDLLPLINSRGITHLAVPDRPSVPVSHRFKEAEAALDRIKQAFSYSAEWRPLANADVAIASKSPKVMENYNTVLHIEDYLNGERQKDEKIPLRLQPQDPEERSESFQQQVARLDSELFDRNPETLRLRQLLADCLQNGIVREEYRCLPPVDAINMLGGI